MKKISILLVMIMAAFAVNAQVAINKDGSAPDASSILDVKGTSGTHFFINDANGRVGINTVTPLYDLSVNGTIQVPYSGSFYVGAYPGLSWNPGKGSVLIGGGSTNVELKAGATTLLYLNRANSNVGIGTTSPRAGSLLDVQAGNKRVIFRTDDGYGVHVDESDGDFFAIDLMGYGTRGKIDINEAGVSKVSFDADPSVPSYINAGNFGIGIDTPSEKLEVVGNTYVTGDITANGDLWGTNGYLTDNLEVAGTGEFTGNVGIGTTPGAALHIKATSTSITSGIRLETSGATNEDWYMYMNGTDDLVIRNDASDLLTISKDNGFFGIGAAVPTAKLDVSGSIRMNDGNQAVNNMMVSDANGKATWTNVNDGVRTRVIRNIGGSGDIVLWSHPEGIEVRFNESTKVVTVENKTGDATHWWDVVINGGATASSPYNTIETTKYKEKWIRDDGTYDTYSFDLGTSNAAWFDIICADQNNNNDGFTMHIVVWQNRINGIVQYWDN